MRILICTPLYPPDIGGPATYSKLLFDELPKHNMDVDVLSFGEVKHLPYVIRHIVYFIKILKRSRGVNIIYAQDPLGVGIPAVFAGKILGKKVFIKIVGDRAWETGVQKFGIKDSLDIFSKKFFYSLPVIIIKYGQWLASKFADKIITPSNYLKTIVSNWGIKEDKISVIYNTFGVSKLVVSGEEARQKTGLNGVILVSAGRLVPWKGFGVLVEIMPDLLKQIPDLKLVIIGDGPEREALMLQVLSSKLQDRVILLGQLKHEEVLQYLNSGDLFVLNTRYEGLSHQILEAMAVGIPVITTDVGGNPELITNNKNGILIEYNNKQQLKNAILKLYRDKKLGEKFIQNAKQKVKEFGKEKMIKETIKIFS